MRTAFKFAAAGAVLANAVACTPVNPPSNGWNAAAQSVTNDARGNDNIETVNAQQLADKIIKEIRAQKPEVFLNYDPFPAHQSLFERVQTKIEKAFFGMQTYIDEGFFRPQQIEGGYIFYVKGLDRDNKYAYAEGADWHMRSGVFNDGSSCEDNSLERDYQEFRIFVGLHETGHYFANVLLSTMQKIYIDKMGKDKVDTDGDMKFYLALNEQLADATAAFYVMSNFSDAMLYVQEIEDWRRANADPSHATANTLAAARQDFQLHPRHGIMFVEAAQWAARVVAAQPNMQQEIAAVEKTEALIKSGLPNYLLEPEVAVEFEKVAAARARFCNPSWYQQLVR